MHSWDKTKPSALKNLNFEAVHDTIPAPACTLQLFVNSLYTDAAMSCRGNKSPQTASITQQGWAAAGDADSLLSTNLSFLPCYDAPWEGT